MASTRFRLRLSKVLIAVVVLAMVVAGALWWLFTGNGGHRATAYFTRAVGVYAGSDVRVLGVRVGQVDSVTPRGELVEVGFTVDPDVRVAADTGVLVIAPSVVSDRYLQLTTLAKGNAKRLTDGAVIEARKTATPVELDELYRSLNDLTTALGPHGANANGALTDLLNTGAANMAGNGQAFNDAVRNFAELSRTLAGSKDNLFGTIDELQKFTTMLAGNDRQIRDVNQQISQVWQSLAADRGELSRALNLLGTALAEIQGFIRDNRANIKSNVDKLAQITQRVVDRRASVAEALDVVPLAATNIVNAFDPATGSLQGRTNLLDYLVTPAPSVATGPPLPLPQSGGGR